MKLENKALLLGVSEENVGGMAVPLHPCNHGVSTSMCGRCHIFAYAMQGCINVARDRMPEATMDVFTAFPKDISDSSDDSECTNSYEFIKE